MPIAKIQTPDGRIARFEVPEGMSEQEVTAFAQSHFGGGEQAAPVPAAPDRGIVGNIAQNVKDVGEVGRGVLQGTKDVGFGLGQLAKKVIPDAVANRAAQLNDTLQGWTGIGERVGDTTLEQRMAADEEKYQAARQKAGRGEGYDWARLGGNVLATAPLAATPGLALTKGAALLSRAGAGNVLKGTAQGLAGSQLEPIRSPEELANEAETRKDRALLGGGIGAASVPVGAALGRIISPKSSEEVQRLINEKVYPTIGQTLGGISNRIEEGLMSAPFIGDAIRYGRKGAEKELNRAAYARALRGMEGEGVTGTAPLTTSARRPGEGSQPYRPVEPTTIDQPGTSLVPREEVIGTAERIPGTAVGTPLNEIPPNPQLGQTGQVGPMSPRMLAQGLETAKKQRAAAGEAEKVVGGSNISGEAVPKSEYRKAVKGLDVDTSNFPTGPEGIARVEQILSDKYDEILPKVTFRMNDNTLGNDLDKIGRKVQDLGEQQYNTFQAEIRDINNKLRNGSMSGRTFKGVQSHLINRAKGFKASGSQYERELGGLLDETLTAMRNSLERTNPLHAPRLRQLNENWANFSRIRDAGSRSGDQTKGFTTTQLDEAVRAGAGGGPAGKGKIAMNTATMRDLSQAGLSTLRNKLANSGTADRAIINSIAAAIGGGIPITTPAITSLAAGSIPAAAVNTPLGRKIMANILARRPEGAADLSQAFQQMAPVLGGALQREEQ